MVNIRSAATPIGLMEHPTPTDVAFFREYAGMSEEEKGRYRDAMKLMFPPKQDEEQK